MTTQHTPTPWRIGDAGFTIFGPPNGSPSPKIVAYLLYRSDGPLILRGVNSHAAVVKALAGLADYIDADPAAYEGDDDHALGRRMVAARAALKLASEG